MKTVKVHSYRYGNGIWIGRYAFFRIPGYLLPVVAPRFEFSHLGVVDRETGAAITNLDAYLAKDYLGWLK